MQDLLLLSSSMSIQQIACHMMADSRLAVLTAGAGL
jgi:hypothetical protein